MADIKYTFIIITYSRDDVLEEQFAVLEKIGKHRRDVEIVLVDNNGDPINREHYIEKFENSNYIKLEDNLGVTGGRNQGINVAKGRYLIFIDDDAIFEDPENLLVNIDKNFEDTCISVVAFKSRNYFTNICDPREFPHTDKSKMLLRKFETFQFVGVGHVIDTKWLGEFRYDETYFYSMEEFDLCFWLINRGSRIVYDASICVRHKVDPSGRLPTKEKLEKQLTNRMKNNYKYLPLTLFLVSSWLRIMHTLLKTRSLMSVVRPLKEFSEWLDMGQRKDVLSKPARQYLKRVGANLL